MAQVFLYVKFHEDFVGHFLFKRRRYSGELWLREFGVFSSEDRKNPAPGMDDVTISTSYHIWNRIHSAMTEQLMSFSLHIYKRPQQPTPTTQIEGVFLLLISEMNSLELENVPEINPETMFLGVGSFVVVFSCLEVVSYCSRRAFWAFFSFGRVTQELEKTPIPTWAPYGKSL